MLTLINGILIMVITNIIAGELLKREKDLKHKNHVR
jgi:hypothetical protein